MECKVFMATVVKAPSVPVLIETLWNVKCICPGNPEASASVLIETLWNVKFDTALIHWPASFVLIETLWNVKYSIPFLMCAGF